MRRDFQLNENGIRFGWSVLDDGRVAFRYLRADDPPESADAGEVEPTRTLVEVQLSGHPQTDGHSGKHIGSMPGGALSYRSHQDDRTAEGRRLAITQQGLGLQVTSCFQFFDGIPVMRCRTIVSNTGERPEGLEYVSSFSLTGLTDEGLRGAESTSFLHIPHSSWSGEGNWKRYTLADLGLSAFNRLAPWSTKRLQWSSTGTWTSAEVAPVGCFEDTSRGHVLFWQIEHNGSWQWEIGEQKGGELYLQISGPTEAEHHWWKNLKPGESFETVPVAVGVLSGELEACFAELTRYRRRIRRPHQDNVRLPVIFNDFFHCLWAESSAEKERPHIAAAASAGCEYYCVDAGWFGSGPWSSCLGEWKHSEERFPGGMRGTFGEIEERGMVPGLWVEIEVVTADSDLARTIPDDWVFTRHGKRVVINERLQLDFRNPEVIAHADRTLERMISEYGARYVKIDYNLNAGPGTERGADSTGDGLLQHNRAYLNWLERLMALELPSQRSSILRQKTDRLQHLLAQVCGNRCTDDHNGRYGQKRDSLDAPKVRGNRARGYS